MTQTRARPAGRAQPSKRSTRAPGGGKFVCESEAYKLLAQAGIRPPRHALLGRPMRFKKGEPIVLKGLGEGLWHKSEVGAVHFLNFNLKKLVREAGGMQTRIQDAGHPWIGALVCERVEAALSGGLPHELLVSLARSEAGWLVVVGLGGMGVEALAEHVKPLCWPVDYVSPAVALAELEDHLLGGILLGTQRGSTAITTRARLNTLIESLWRLAVIAGENGLSQLEMNPVVFDQRGHARPLDAAGVREPQPQTREGPPHGFLKYILRPRSAAIAGVSARPGGIGYTVLENLRRCPSLEGRITLVKPGAHDLFGIPCVTNVSALKKRPVDLLVLATPALAAVEALEQLITQGGGARVVGVIASGIGDGADRSGLGVRLSTGIAKARAAGRWTPAVLGPNFMGHWVPGSALDTTFIPRDKLPRRSETQGSLALLSQSGAFLLGRRSKNPGLGLFLGAALGNQIDVSLPDFLEMLVATKECWAVAAYVEGFPPGHLGATVRAAAKLRDRGVRVLLHRAGRTRAGRDAASSHTGAIAGDLAVERAVLGRAGVRFSESVAAFDAALSWLAAYPQMDPRSVALVSNAGFECVTGSDAFSLDGLGGPGSGLSGIGPETLVELTEMLESEGLVEIVNPRLPLDLTPMASESAFLRAAEILARGESKTLVIGLVPFTSRLSTGDAAPSFASALAAVSQASGKPVGIVIDAGDTYTAYKEVFIEAGLPVFDRFEDAILGLKTLA